MTSLKKILACLRKDEDGATLVEYSLLIGLVTAVLVFIVIGVGDWASDAWTLLCSNVTTAANDCAAATPAG